ncbi:UNVERIFIED_CONTAM: hypothetical protein Slati_2434900 [Sesamum latifolium]|uniref:Reverse transcriptase domain-containing protein n=1 Tax=Sesamum latifolium TaxID=2727402 RepID=A0AAW2WCS7_9LAMI
MISLPLTLGTSPLRETCLLKFLVVDIPSACSVILGRPTLNAFRAIISTYHMKIKFPVAGGVGEAQADAFQARKCYVEAIKRGKKRVLEEAPREENSNKRGKDPIPRPEPKEEAPVTVQPAEELLTVELIPGDPEKLTKIGSKMEKNVRDQVVDLLRKNKNIFAWTPQDLEGIDPGHIREIQFPEWLSNVVLVPKPGGKRRMCIDFRDLNKACPKDFYPLSRIDQLVDSTSGCELLSMMDASQGYHQIMLAPEDHKRINFITSDDTFCYMAMPFGLKNIGATYQRLVDKIFRPQLGRNMEVTEKVPAKTQPREMRIWSHWGTIPRIYGDPMRYRGQPSQDQGYPGHGTPTNINEVQ